MEDQLTQEIKFIVKNWDKIPDKFKTNLKPDRYKLINDLALDEHIVILLISRQKPSIRPCYDFDEERIGLTRTGKVVWGFDSGCSCPIPWEDSFPDCYNVSKSWKKFIVNLTQFDVKVIEECFETIEKIKKEIK